MLESKIPTHLPIADEVPNANLIRRTTSNVIIQPGVMTQLSFTSPLSQRFKIRLSALAIINDVAASFYVTKSESPRPTDIVGRYRLNKITEQTVILLLGKHDKVYVEVEGTTYCRSVLIEETS